jgi:hypothetical protein
MLTFCLSSFQASLFILVPIIILFRNGSLGSLLGELSTPVGLALFLVLWAVSLYCSRRALRDLEPAGENVGLRDLLEAASVWGGWTGAAFFLLALTPLLAGALILNGGDGGANPVQVVAFLLSVGFVGSAVAYLIGSAVGFIFGCLYAVLSRLVALVVPIDSTM